MLANAAAIAALLTALFAAPLVLGSYIAVQHASPLQSRLWFLGVIALLGLSLLFATGSLAVLLG